MRNCPNSPRVPLKRQDLIALNKRSNLRPATLHHYERRIDETLFFIQRAFGAKLVGSLRRDRPLKIQRKNSGSGNKCLRAIGTTTRSLRNWVRSAKNLIWIAGLIDLS
jgi:hypothetical protein